MVSGLIGAYHLMQERSTNMAHKPHYEQPYECGFNQMGGVIFAGFTFVIWVFLLFELEIIMVTKSISNNRPKSFSAYADAKLRCEPAILLGFPHDLLVLGLALPTDHQLLSKSLGDLFMLKLLFNSNKVGSYDTKNRDELHLF
jgi:hypothetical protein